MAFERIGLGGILTFDGSQAVVAMGQAASALGGLNAKATETPTVWKRMGMAVTSTLDSIKSKIGGVANGMEKIGGAVGAAALGAAPITFGLSKAFNTAVDFERQMSNVFAVINSDGKMSEQQLLALRNKAQEMGAASVFTSTEAGAAMEAMAKNGANAEEIMVALGAVMDAAAADGIGLAEAADVVSAVANGMRRPMSEAASITDVLAKAASISATSIRDLGESFKYGAPFAAELQYTVAETAAAFAAVSNSGLGASVGGTALTQMLEHMTKVTPKGQKVLDRLGVSLTDAAGNVRKLQDVIPDLSDAFDKKFKGTKARGEAIVQLFGTEGARAFGALLASVKNADPEKQLGGILEQLNNAEGTAKRQAAIRLDNFFGKWTQLMGAVESFSIEVFGMVSNHMKGAVDGAAELVGRLTAAFVAVKNGDIAGSMQANGRTITQVALGVRDTILIVQDAWTSLMDTIRQTGREIGITFGAIGVRELTRFIGLFIVAAGAGAPLLAGVLGIGFAVKAIVIPALLGMLSIASAVFTPMGMLIAGAILLLWDLRDTIVEIAGGMWASFSGMLPDLGEMWTQTIDVIKFALTDIYNFIFGSNDGVETDWREVGMTIMSVIGAVVETGVTLFQAFVLGITGIIKLAYWLGETIMSTLFFPLTWVMELVENVAGAFGMMFGGDIMGGIAKLFTAIMDWIVAPFRHLFSVVVRGMEALGMEVGPKLQAFMDSGFTGLMEASAQPTAVPAPPRRTPTGMPETVADQALQATADQEKRKAEKQKVEANVTLDDKRKIEMTNKLCVDGREMAVATGKHTQELNERAGFKATPWQRRMTVEQGSAPVTR